MQNKTYTTAFTLIELTIVIIIIGLISFAAYFPYAYHQKKIYLQEGAKDISQVLTQARNIAIHGYSHGTENHRSYIEMIPGTSQIQLYSAPFTEIDHHKKQLLSTLVLPRGIQLHLINGTTTPRVFIYDAISGDISAENSVLGDYIDIILSYKNSDSPTLQKNIRYYTATHISDY